MDAKNDTQLTAESQEITDSTQFSLVALVSLLFSLVGIFSLRYMQVIPFTILGGVLGAFAMLTSKHFQLGKFSRAVALLGFIVSATVASWGFSLRSLDYKYDLSKAETVARSYLESLSKGDMTSVNYLVGFPLDLSDQDATTNQDSKAVRCRGDCRRTLLTLKSAIDGILPNGFLWDWMASSMAALAIPTN